MQKSNTRPLPRYSHSFAECPMSNLGKKLAQDYIYIFCIFCYFCCI